MTQAHKTPGAIVILKEDYLFGLEFLRGHRFEVLGESFPGHLHVKSIDDPLIEYKGLHDERFATYKGSDIKALKEKISR